MYAAVIPIFSPLWWQYTALFGTIVGAMLILARTRYKELAANAFGFFVIFDLFFLQFLRLDAGMWDVTTALPLQFCNVMSSVSGIALLTRWRWSFELLLFLGILAPLQAIITPGFAFSHPYYILCYYITHGTTIVTPFFLMSAFGMRPRPSSWWKVDGGFALFIVLIATFDYSLNANYMFLMAPPNLVNPLVLGKWPYYVLIWVLLLLVTSSLIYCMCRKATRES